MADCDHPLVNDRDEFIAQVCHIEAAEAGGPRYNPQQTDEERRHSSNLLLLCYRHHVESNSVERYPTETLRAIKAAHESAYKEAGVAASDALLDRISADLDRYWQRVAAARAAHVLPELAVPLDPTASFAALVDAIEAALTWIDGYCSYVLKQDEEAYADLLRLLDRMDVPVERLETIPYWENPFVHRHWEMTALGLSNAVIRMRALVAQADLLHHHLRQQAHPEDAEAAVRLQRAKERFIEVAATAALVD